MPPTPSTHRRPVRSDWECARRRVVTARRRLIALFVVAVLAVVLSASLAACSLSSDDGVDVTAAVPQPGGTLTFPLPGQPPSIEPLNAQDASGLQVAHQVFQGLTRWTLNDDGVLVTEPEIAASWESVDAQTWTFHLKPGVTFQAPVSRTVTAQDFVDSWSRITDPQNQSYTAYILAALEGCDDRGYQVDPAQGLTGVRAVDDQTLQVTLRYPLADLPAILGHPAAAVTPVDYIDELGAKAFARRPVGTGPYAVQSWRRGREIRLVKNPTFWDASEHPVYVDEVVLPFYDDVEAMWADFEAGELDCSQAPADALPAMTATEPLEGDGWTARSWPAAAVYLVGLNMSDPTLAASPELRVAISRAADAQGVVDCVNPGAAEIAGGYVPNGIPGFDAARTPYPPDAQAAATVVAALPEVPSLKYWYDCSDDHRRIADTLIAGWEVAGLRVKPADYEWGTFLDRLARSGKGDGSQLFRVAWIADYPAMDAFLFPLFHSDQAPTGSYTFYFNQGVDDLLQKARATMDGQQRRNLYAQAEKLILTDMPAVPLYYYRYLRVVAVRVNGFRVDPMGTTDMSALWLEQG
jgi:oligopeptide transport system substrate-binding protein